MDPAEALVPNKQKELRQLLHLPDVPHPRHPADSNAARRGRTGWKDHGTLHNAGFEGARAGA
eukprot:3759787-Karenia_brevis.AAC.1